MTKLDTDPTSAAAKPGGAAPAKGPAPRPSMHDPATGPWVRFWKDKPQHWGPPSTVKSAAELADANISGAQAQHGQHHAAQAQHGQQDPAQAEHDAPADATNIDSGTVAELPNTGPGSAGASVSPHGAAWSDRDSTDDSMAESDRDGNDQFGEAAGVVYNHTISQAWQQQEQQQRQQAADVEDLTASRQDAPQAAAAAADFPPAPPVTTAGLAPAVALKSAAATSTAATVAPAAAAVQAAVSVPQGSRAADAIKAAKHRAFNMYSPSKGTLRVLQKPPSNKPSPKKQVPLDQMLKQRAEAAAIRAAAAASVTHTVMDSAQADQTQQRQRGSLSEADGNSGIDRFGLDQATDLASDPAFEPQQGTAQQAQRGTSNQAQLQVLPQVVLPHAAPTLAQSERFRSLQGLTLSQIDASVFAALPAQHQHELLNNLSKATSRQDSTAGAKRAADDFGFVTKLANLQKTAHGEGVEPAGTLSQQADQSHTKPRPEASTAVTLSKDVAPLQEPSQPSTSRAADADNVIDVAHDSSQPSVASAHSNGHWNSSPTTGFGVSNSDHDVVSPPPLCNSMSPEEAAHPVQAVQTGNAESKPLLQLQQVILPQQLPASLAAAPTPSTAAAQSAAAAPSVAAPASPSTAGAPDVHGPKKDAGTADAGSAHAAAVKAADAMIDDAMVDDAMQERESQDEDPNVDQGVQQISDEEFHTDFQEHLDVDLVEEERAALGMQVLPGNSMQHEQATAALPAEHAVQSEAGGAAQQGKQDKSNSNAAVLAGRSMTVFPTASQIDASVLDALPLQVRRELEMAYGVYTLLSCCPTAQVC